MSATPTSVLCFSDSPRFFPHRKYGAAAHRRFRVYCNSETTRKQIRKYSLLLEGPLLLSSDAMIPDDLKCVPDVWSSSADKYGDRIALVDPYHDPPSNISYKQLEQDILNFSEGLRVVGVKPNEIISIFADNSCRWLVADQGVMAIGAINVVRGSRSSISELLQIYNHSESVALIVDNPEMFNQIAEQFYSKEDIRFVILLWGEKSRVESGEFQGIPVFSYKEVTELGYESRKKLNESNNSRKCFIYEAISPDDVATIVYTSGTTGNPKGVMLTHRNLLHQIKNFWDIVPAQAGDRFLSMLPPWHMYERACEYFIFSHGAEQVYTSVRNLKEDMKRNQPQYLLSVPLVYETLYSGIMKQISSASNARKFIALSFIRMSMAYAEAKRIYEGKCLTKSQKQPSSFISLIDWFCARLVAAILWPMHMLANKLIYSNIRTAVGISKAGISGGGSLPLHVDKFFEAVGVLIQNGYGLTESSPVIAARRPTHNVLGSVGHPLRHTEFRIVDSETGKILAPGSKGIVKVRGVQVMKGYYKNPSATKQVLDEDGWLDTGDVGWIAPSHSRGRSRNCGGVIVLEGRAKDTIVLSSGENVEPAELEEAAMRSVLIKQIVVMGQDQRRLGAIVVPDREELLNSAKKLSLVDSAASEVGEEKMLGLLHDELRTCIPESRFQIGPILIVDEPFTIDNGLMAPTMKIRRDKVVAKFKEQIENLYK